MMTQIRMLALDVDGTLTFDRHEVSARTRQALHELARENIEIVIATGRRYRTTRWVMESLEMDVYSTCNGGTLVKRPDQSTLHRHGIPSSQAKDITRLAREHDICLFGQRDSHIDGGADFILDEEVSFSPQTLRYYQDNFEYAAKVDLLQSEDEMLNMGCFGDENSLSRFASELHQHCPGLFNTTLLPHLDTDTLYCEINRNGVNKWTGLMTLAEELNIHSSQICAAGDQLNDVPMITNAGHGFAMGNAHPQLKDLADKICGDHDKDGLLPVIEYIRNHNKG